MNEADWLTTQQFHPALNNPRSANKLGSALYNMSLKPLGTIFRAFSDAPLASTTNLIKRLRHQSLKRGTSENGILLGAFAEGRLGSMSHLQLREYEDIICENDVDLFNWMSGLRVIPDKYRDSKVFAEISQFYQARKKVYSYH